MKRLETDKCIPNALKVRKNISLRVFNALSNDRISPDVSRLATFLLPLSRPFQIPRVVPPIFKVSHKTFLQASEN